MSKMDIAKSIHQRLLNVRDKTGEPFNNLLVHYGLERLLYRLVRGLRLRTTIALGLTPLRSVNPNAERMGRLYSHDNWYRKMGQIKPDES